MQTVPNLFQVKSTCLAQPRAQEWSKVPTWLWAEDCSSERRVEGRGLLPQPALLAGRGRRCLPSQHGQVTAVPPAAAQADLAEPTCLQPQGGINLNWLLTPLAWTSPAWLVGLTVDVEMCTKGPFLSLWDMGDQSGCCANSSLVDIWWAVFPCCMNHQEWIEQSWCWTSQEE